MQYDVVIVGGGFVGLSLAYGLDKFGFKCAVLEKNPGFLEICDKEETIKENRGLALSATSINILTSLGIWSELQNFSTPIKTIHISEKNRFGSIKLNAEDHKLKNFGEVISAERLLFALNRNFHKLQHGKLYFNTKIKRLESLANGWNLNLTIENSMPKKDRKIQLKDQNKDKTEMHSDEITLKCKLLIGADGTNSFIRNYAGISVEEKLYNKQALVFNLYLNNNHNNVAYERFCKDITLAIVPFGSKKAKCIIMADNDKINQLQNLGDEEVIKEIYHLIGSRIGIISGISRKISYPLVKTIAKDICKDNLVLIGNAANTILPIAAQGLNLGLRDVAFLIEALLFAKQEGLGINDKKVLESYSDLRKCDHQKTVNFSERVSNLFVNEKFPVFALRGIGLAFTGLSERLQKKIIERGLGFVYRLPMLAGEDFSI